MVQSIRYLYFQKHDSVVLLLQNKRGGHVRLNSLTAPQIECATSHNANAHIIIMSKLTLGGFYTYMLEIATYW